MPSEGEGEAEAIVRLDGVWKSFGDVTVLRGVDVDVAPAEKIAIIGGSGSGKSTLLRIVMTLERPERGTVTIDGIRAYGGDEDGQEARLAEARSRCGMVFQHFNLFPHLTAVENVALAPRLVKKESSDAARERALRYLDMVGLAEHVERHPAALSGGQKQRVGIARALAMEPKVILFDEVTSGLDPELVAEVLAVMRGLGREGGMTMLIVTHQMEFAREIADRVLFLDGGLVLEDGPPEQVFGDPREERTRQFLQTVLEAR